MKKIRSLQFLIVYLILLLSIKVKAQWENGLSGFLGTSIRSSIVFNNNLYVGGTFSDRVVRTDGNTVFNSFTKPAALTDVLDFEIFNSQLYAAGTGGLFRLNTTTNTWEHLISVTGSVGIKALEVYNNKLYLGGGFLGLTLVSNSAYSNVGNFAFWDSTNGIQIPATRPNGTVNALLKSPTTNQLFVGGTFTQVGSIANSNNTAIYQGEGSNWLTFSVRPNGLVEKLLAVNNTVFSVGSFANLINNTGVTSVGQYVSILVSSSWQSLTNNTGQPYTITAGTSNTAQAFGDELYLAIGTVSSSGTSFSVNGQTTVARNIVKYNTVTKVMSPVGNPFNGVNGTGNTLVIRTMSVFNNKLHIFGGFTEAGNINTNSGHAIYGNCPNAVTNLSTSTITVPSEGLVWGSLNSKPVNVSGIQNATHYVWKLPPPVSGVSILSITSPLVTANNITASPSITVNAGQNTNVIIGTHTLGVAGTNGCEEGPIIQTNINVVDKLSPTVSISGLNEGLPGNIINLSATSNSSGAITWSVLNNIDGTPGTGSITSGGVLTLGNSGKIKVIATSAANGDYASGFTELIVTINKIPVTANITNLTQTYNGQIKTITISSITRNDNGSVVTVSPTISYTLSGNTINPISAGNYNVVITLDNSAVNNNYVISNISPNSTLTINKATLTVTAENKSRYFGAPNPSPTIVYSGFQNSENSSALATLATASIAPSATADANAGTTHSIIPSGGVADNYTFSYVNGVLTINPAPTSLAFTNTTHTYDGTAKTLTVNTTPTGVPNTVNYTPHATPTNVGTYTATVTLNSTNHIISGTNTATLTINPATPVVTMTSANSGVVNGTITLTANTGGSNGTITFERQNLTGTATLTGNQLSLTAAGTVQVRALVAGTTNFAAATSAWQTITISNLLTPTLTLTSPNGNTVVYGNTLTGFILTENSDGAVSWSVTNGTGAATYDAATNTLTPTQAGTITLTATTAQTATYAQGSASITITILLPAPTLYSPSNAATGIHPTTNFYINYIDGLTSLEYQFDSDNDFTTNTTDAVTNTITNFSNEVYEGSWRHRFGMTNLKFGKTYYWRVRISTGATNTSAWSSVRSFSTIPSPTLYSPNDVAAGIHPTTNFYINYIDGLTSLEYQFDSDNDFTTNTADALTSTITNFSNEVFEGSWRHRFQMTNLKFGKTYYWRVRVSTSATNSSAWSSVRSFSTIPSPTLYSPTNAATSIHPTTNFYINYIDGLTSLEYQFDSDNDFTTATADALTSTITNFSNEVFEGSWRHRFGMTNLKFGKTYYWRVRVSTSATNVSEWSSVRSFSTIVSPTLTAPNTNALNISTAGTNLTWQDLSGESGYEVQLSTSNLYESFIVNAAQTTATRTTGALVANTTYFWRVRAKITIGANDFYSAWAERVFSTGATIATPPASPTLTAPTNNATNQIFTPTLTWSVVAGASYEYQYSTDQNFLTNITTGTTTVGTNQYQTPALAEQTTYYWRVRAIQNNLASAWSATFNFTTKRNVTIAFSNTEPVYDGTAKGITVTTTPAGVAYTIAYTQGGNTIANPTTAGDYLATVTITDNTYQLTNANTATLSIKQRPTTLAFANTTHTYDGTAKTITVTTTPTGVPNTVTYTPIATPTNAGTYTATVTLNSTNHIISGTNTATLTINPATPVVTMTSSNSGVVNGTITLTANTGGSNGTITFERQNLTGTATLAGNQLSLTTIGTVQVRALVAATTNYNAAISDWQTITINNLLTPTLSLTGTNTVVYGNTLNGFVLTENSDGAVSWSVTNGTGAATYDAATNTLTPTQAGTVTLTATTAQTATYAQGTASLVITISPKTLMITGTTVQTTKEYNRNASVQITNAGTLEGVLAADVGQVTLTTGTASYADFNVGTNKAISFTGFSLVGAKVGNYTLAAQPTATTGSITAKPVSITGVTVQAKNYDGTTAATINNAGTVNGLIAPDVLTAQAGTATFADANAGTNKTVNLTGFTLAGAAAVLSNYTLSAQPQAISNGIINQATLTAVAENKSRVYGQANPTLTIQYTGFVNNETAAVLDQSIQVATTATAESNVGTYPITLTGGVDNNYAINKGNGILTITQATQTITVTTQSGTRALSNGTFTVEAAASSNLPLTVTSSNPAIASVNGNTITMHQLGEVTLTFSQAGNQNYLPATNVTRTFTIVNETKVIGLATEALVEPVIVGFPHLRLITVSNTGNAPLTINNIAHSTKVTLDDAQFTIAAGATHTVAATLVVAEEGTYTEELVFESDATSGSNTITLNGEAFLITDAEESHQTEVKVGPNPGENFINIKGKIKSDVLIKDLQGRVMKRKLSKAEEKDSYILDIHDLPAGMFLLELKAVNDKSITKKIIKK